MKPSSDLLADSDLDPIVEFDEIDDFGEVFEAALFSAVLLSALCQFEHYGQHCFSGQTALCSLGSVSNGGKG
jgi:hypothetical protein